MSACCDAAGQRKTPMRVRRVCEACAWIMPAAVLVLVPKCPACVAAHVLLWTGIGLSFTAAAYVRWGLLFVCVAALAFVAMERLVRKRARYLLRQSEISHRGHRDPREIRRLSGRSPFPSIWGD
jgi:cell division protein FtsW (lipid II flippase)